MQMDETKKMLQAVINGQSALKEELLKKIDEVNSRVEGVDSKVIELQKEMRDGFKKFNDRLDKIGTSLAYLEDDAPTQDEFDNLEHRVEKLENSTTTN